MHRTGLTYAFLIYNLTTIKLSPSRSHIVLPCVFQCFQDLNLCIVSSSFLNSMFFILFSIYFDFFVCFFWCDCCCCWDCQIALIQKKLTLTPLCFSASVGWTATASSSTIICVGFLSWRWRVLLYIVVVIAFCSIVRRVFHFTRFLQNTLQGTDKVWKNKTNELL